MLSSDKVEPMHLTYCIVAWTFLYKNKEKKSCWDQSLSCVYLWFNSDSKGCHTVYKNEIKGVKKFLQAHSVTRNYLREIKLNCLFSVIWGLKCCMLLMEVGSGINDNEKYYWRVDACWQKFDFCIIIPLFRGQRDAVTAPADRWNRWMRCRGLSSSSSLAALRYWGSHKACLQYCQPNNCKANPKHWVNT